jgi:hypothetical protein
MPSTADDRAPHTAARTDVLKGQNASFVFVGERGKYSLITDTCTNCHMELTPPPADLSYNLGGTSHAFGASRRYAQSTTEPLTAALCTMRLRPNWKSAR